MKSRTWINTGIFSVFVLVLAGAVGGCVGYQLGSTLPPGLRSIYIPTFVNRSGEPFLDSEATKAVIQEFQRDGTLRVAGADDADAVLEGTVTAFTLVPVRYERDRATTATEYRMTITASILLRDRATHKVLLERPSLEGEQDFPFAGDMTSAKRSALPKAARDLAHDVVEAVVEFW